MRRYLNKVSDKKLKKLGGESAYKEVFEQFEVEIAKLRRDGERLVERNMRLETKNIELAKRAAIGVGGGNANDSDALSQPPMHFQNGIVKQLSRRNKELETEVKKLTRENASLHQQSRMLNVSKTQNAQSQSSMMKLGEQLNHARHQFNSVSAGKNKVETELMMAQQVRPAFPLAHTPPP